MYSSSTAAVSMTDAPGFPHHPRPRPPIELSDEEHGVSKEDVSLSDCEGVCMGSDVAM